MRLQMLLGRSIQRHVASGNLTRNIPRATLTISPPLFLATASTNTLIASPCISHGVDRRSYGSRSNRGAERDDDRFKPTEDNPATISPTPVRKYFFCDISMHLILDDFVEKKAFKRLMSVYKEYDEVEFDIDESRWEVKLDALEKGFIQSFRNDLKKHHFELGRFPGFDPGSSNALNAAERISLGMADDTVVIIQSEKAFLIVCPSNDMDIQSIITDELTGVTDEASQDQFDDLKFISCSATFVTYDIWLVAEFIDLLQKQQPDISIELCDDADESLKSRFDRKRTRQRPIAQVTSIMDEGCHLYPHQNEGVRFLQDNGGRGIISFEMGLGKTATTLAYIASEGRRAVVVCPKNVRSVWIEEALQLFSKYFRGHTLQLGSDWKATSEETDEKLSQARLVCINYEAMKKFLPSILKAGFDCLVLDESHALKNPKAKRTQQILESKDSFQHRILLSGTPIKNKVSELTTQLEIAGFHHAGDMRNMSAGAVWNLLHESGVYIQKSLQGELSHLQMSEPRLIDVEFDQDEIEFIDDWDDPGEQGILAQVQAKKLHAAHIKAPSTCEWAVKKLSDDPDSKVIIFTERRKIAEKIYSTVEVEDPGISLLHHGRLREEERSCILKQFKSEPHRRILVSTRPSLAVGVNLQCANIVIFNDMPWTPADIRQAVGRTRRLNQKKAVSEYWMKSTTEFDGSLFSLLQEKLQLIKQYAEGKNLRPDQIKWMNKGVSAYDIAGIERPKPDKTNKK